MKYRTPNVQLICRDINLCFTVGFNVRFKFNKNTFVGHLKNYSITYSRNSEGTHRTTTVLNLERVVIETADGSLDYMDERLIRNMFDKPGTPQPLNVNVKNILKAQEEEKTKNANAARKLRNSSFGPGASQETE
jgi:hypothetical protein